MLRKGVIYKYTFPNGKVYIGQTRRDPSIRHREHFLPSTGPLNNAFWQAYKEQGEPAFEILEDYQSEDMEELVCILNQRETENIRLYKATDPQHGYNRVATGMVRGRLENKIKKAAKELFPKFYELKRPLWESMKEKIETPDTMTKEERELYDFYFVEINPFCGASDEFIRWHWLDFAEFSFKDDIQSEVDECILEHIAELQEDYVDADSILQLDKNDNIIAIYENQADAATALGLTSTANINNVVLGKQKTAHGYKWVRVGDYRPSTQLSLFDNL